MGFFDNLKEKATDLAQSGVAKSKQLAEIAKLKTANMGEEDAIKKAYLELGKLYYAERGCTPEAAYAAACERITASKAAIETNNGRIAQLKASSGIDDAAERAAAVVEDVRDAAVGAAIKAKDTAADVAEKVKGAVTNAPEKAADEVEDVQQKLSDAVETVREKADNMAEEFEKNAGSAVEEFRSAVDAAEEAAKSDNDE